MAPLELRLRDVLELLGDLDLRRAELARRAGFVFQDPEAQFVASTVRSEVLAGLVADDPSVSGAVEEANSSTVASPTSTRSRSSGGLV